MRQDNREKFVIFIDDKTKESFDKLKVGKFEDKQLYEFINRAMDDLKKDPEIGIHIQKPTLVNSKPFADGAGILLLLQS